MHTVLVVDDDFDCGRVLARLLTVIGNEAISVSSGQLALDSLQIRIPRLVILDMMMPEMDGMEVLRHIRHDTKTAHLPVVIFSAMSDRGCAAVAKSNGANGFWVKCQIDFSTLNQLVAAYLALPVAHACLPGHKPARR